MKYEILDVERRNCLARITSVDEYKVTVKLDNGQILKLNAWAGVANPTLDNLIFDIEKQLKKALPSKSKPTPPKWKVVFRAIGKKGEVKPF
ncbi:MAG: hypothetical protein HWN51_03890 [Desulfobacterales bacterium]|nr:hypothetical protein [Desulfobacterales bacterium]